jgi:hypothetical protein
MASKYVSDKGLSEYVVTIEEMKQKLQKICLETDRLFEVTNENAIIKEVIV